MTMSWIDVAAHVVAFCLAASHLITAVAPYWTKLPRWLAVLMPVFVLTLPQIADLAGFVKTETGFIQFCIVAVALLLPGITLAELKQKPPFPPPPEN